MVEVSEVSGVRWVPTAVARRQLGVSRQRIYQLVQSGVLASCRVDGTLMISARSVADRIVWLTGQEEMYGDGRGPRL